MGLTRQQADPGTGERCRQRPAVREAAAGGVLVLLTVIGGVYFARHPAPGAVDGWLDVVGPSKNLFYRWATSLRYPACILLGAVVCAVVVVRRDRVRALACLVAPPLALIVAELAVKPWVGRRLGTGLSYPSGSTVGAAALAAAAVLASAPRWRPIALVLSAGYVAWMSAAVVALGWHFPTDALAGVAFGAGVVLLVDGLSRVTADTWSARSAGGA